jgi:hypothetical protein
MVVGAVAFGFIGVFRLEGKTIDLRTSVWANVLSRIGKFPLYNKLSPT